MRIFVATNEGFKKEKKEILECRENEPVVFGWDESMKTMAGLRGYRLTTAFKVKNVNTTPSMLEHRYLNLEKRKGWVDVQGELNAEKEIREEIQTLVLLAKEYPVGAILERRRGKIKQRI